MKKVILYTVTASMIFSIHARNKEDVSKSGKPLESIELTVKQTKKVDADNRFAFNMFREVLEWSDKPNTFFSPLSLHMALGMLYNGASGETCVEMAKVLGMADFTKTEINEYYQKLAQALQKIDTLTDIRIANSIWYGENFPVKQPFININQNYFDAVVNPLNFNRPDATNIINKWCADKTKDKIKEIVQGPIPGDVMMYLINSLYFKSKWQFEFDKKNTKQDDFSKAQNLKKKVNMMEQTQTLPYYADPYMQCVEMPYGNQAFGMVAILPANNMNIDQLIKHLDDSTWQNTVNNLQEQNVWLKLPRFKIECELPLNEPVRNVGMKRIFGGGFANISDKPLVVSNIKQKTFVEVNEESTEAAAVTVISMTRISYPGTPQRIPFFANRPFLYLIKERSTGVILFIGRMDEPVE
jgi:serpin B